MLSMISSIVATTKAYLESTRCSIFRPHTHVALMYTYHAFWWTFKDVSQMKTFFLYSTLTTTLTIIFVNLFRNCGAQLRKICSERCFAFSDGMQNSHTAVELGANFLPAPLCTYLFRRDTLRCKLKSFNWGVTNQCCAGGDNCNITNEM